MPVLQYVIVGLIPKLIFGTKELTILSDFFVKRINSAFFLGSLASSPIESYICWLFRKPIDGDKVIKGNKTGLNPEEQEKITLDQKAKTE